LMTLTLDTPILLKHESLALEKKTGPCSVQFVPLSVESLNRMAVQPEGTFRSRMALSFRPFSNAPEEITNSPALNSNTCL